MDIAIAPTTARMLWLLGLTPLAARTGVKPARPSRPIQRLPDARPAPNLVASVDRDPRALPDDGDVLAALGILPGIAPLVAAPPPVTVEVAPIPAKHPRRAPSIVVGEGSSPRLDSLFDAVPVKVPPKRSVRVFEWGDVGQAVEDASSDGCRWPVGDPRSAAFSYCGKRREGTRSYCPHHCVVAYMPARSTRPVSVSRLV